MDGPHPTSISHLFTSNTAPRPLEIASIQYEVDVLAKSIDQVQLQLDRLQQRLQKLEGRRRKYRALLSPLRRIPPETLGEIISCVQDSVGEDDRSIPDQSRLISLCLVSRTWRDAALATPKLWSSLEMCGIPTSLWLDTAFLWFGRCKGVFKTLSIDSSLHEYQSCTTPGGGCEFANPLLAKLLTEGPLIDRLNLSFTSSRCFRNLVVSMSSLKIHEPRPWDSIKSLEVRFYDVWDEPGPQDSHPDSIFKHIPPTVSSLYLYLEDRDDIVAINDGLHLHIPEIVLTNLTTFTFSCDWDGTMMLQILQSCTNVENLTLDFRGSSVAFQDAPLLREAGLLLPKVRILHLDQIISGAVSSIQALRTPSLVELRISFVTDVIHPVAFTNRAYVSDNFASSVLSFVRASGCQGSLRKFRFDSISIPNPQLVAILTNLPFLTHLALDNTFFDPTPFGKYDYVYGGSALLPCLAVLELLRLPPDFPRDAMSHFAVARKLELPPGGLKKFVMTFRKYQPPDLSLLVDKFKNTFPIETTCFAFV